MRYSAIIRGRIVGQIPVPVQVSIEAGSGSQSVFYSIFDSVSSNSGSIHQIYDLTLPRLRTRPCNIRLNDEYRVRTPLRHNLPGPYVFFKKK